MKIGPVEIPGISVLAPLAGITDLPFRLICKEMGASLVYTEMVSAEGLIRNQPATLDVIKSIPVERPVSFQIFGSKPASMAEAARRLSDRGAELIDINMGCPAQKVTRNGSGAALLKDLGIAREVIEVVVKASSAPVTIKIRTGWFASDFVAVELAKMAEEIGVSAIAVHGRYARQGFSGHADWSAIKAVKETVRIPVIGNGDITTAEDAARMISETGCDLVMIGRGALGYPWIFREVEALLMGGTIPAPPTPAERGRMLIRHMLGEVERMGELHGIRFMRKHAAWYAKGLTGCAEFRRNINYADTGAAFADAVEGFFI